MMRVALVLLFAGCGAHADADAIAGEDAVAGADAVADAGADAFADADADADVVADADADVGPEVVDDRELPELFPDEVRSLPMAELVWTYRPEAGRWVDPRESVLAAMPDFIVALTLVEIDGVVTAELTALSGAGSELWRVPTPRAIDRVAPILDDSGATWVFSDDAAYRVSAKGKVLWERSLGGALRTHAAAVDGERNAYAVVDHTAMSLDEDGDRRWSHELTGGPPQRACDDPSLRYAPAVFGDHVFFASDCAVFVATRDGASFVRLDLPWGGDAPALTNDGWLTRVTASAETSAIDSDGVVRATWVGAETAERIFGADGRMFAFHRDHGLGAWDDGVATWHYIGQNGVPDAWLVDVDGRLLAHHHLGGEVAVMEANGDIIFNGLVGRNIRRVAPVSARPGELVFAGHTYDADARNVLTCVRLPFGALPETWSTTHANHRNTRALSP